jgi:hypothetical protein
MTRRLESRPTFQIVKDGAALTETIFKLEWRLSDRVVVAGRNSQEIKEDVDEK